MDPNEILSPVDLHLINEHIILSENESCNPLTNENLIARQKMVIKALKHKWLESKKMCKELREANIDLKQKYEVLAEKQKKWTFYKEAANHNTIIELKESLKIAQNELIQTNCIHASNLKKAVEQAKKQVIREYEKQLKKSEKTIEKLEKKIENLTKNNQISTQNNVIGSNTILECETFHYDFIDIPPLSPIKKSHFEIDNNIYPEKKLKFEPSTYKELDITVPFSIPSQQSTQTNNGNISDPLTESFSFDVKIENVICDNGIIKEENTNISYNVLPKSEESDDGEILSDDDHNHLKGGLLLKEYDSEKQVSSVEIMNKSCDQIISITNLSEILDFMMDSHSMEYCIDKIKFFINSSNQSDLNILCGRICVLLVASFLKGCPAVDKNVTKINDKKHYLPKCSNCMVCFCKLTNSTVHSNKNTINEKCLCLKTILNLLKSDKIIPHYARVIRIAFLIDSNWPFLHIYTRMLECIRLWIFNDRTLTIYQRITLYKIALEFCKLNHQPSMVRHIFIETLTSNSQGDNIYLLANLLVKTLTTYPSSFICFCSNVTYLREFEWCTKLVIYSGTDFSAISCSENLFSNKHMIYLKNYLKIVCIDFINLQLSPILKDQFHCFFTSGNYMLNFYIKNGLISEFVWILVVTYAVTNITYIETIILMKIVIPVLNETKQFLSTSIQNNVCYSDFITKNPLFVKFNAILSLICNIVSNTHQNCTKLDKLLSIFKKLYVYETLDYIAKNLNDIHMVSLTEKTITVLSTSFNR